MPEQATLSPPLRITYGQASHVGLKRSENQDACGVFPPDDGAPLTGRRLFIVADGMGGHRGGREASWIAVEIVQEASLTAAADPAAALRSAFEHANLTILERARQDAALQGMGTTCTALLLEDGQGWIGHVGDSRAYRITPHHMEQLTLDHSRVEEMVRQNLLTREEADRHPQRNVLSRAMGVAGEMETDLYGPWRLHPNEWYLLCSDGLFKHMTEAEIEAVVRAEAPDAACGRLIDLALERGGRDNVTLQIVRIDASPQAEAPSNSFREAPSPPPTPPAQPRKALLILTFAVLLLLLYLLF